MKSTDFDAERDRSYTFLQEEEKQTPSEIERSTADHVAIDKPQNPMSFIYLDTTKVDCISNKYKFKFPLRACRF